MKYQRKITPLSKPFDILEKIELAIGGLSLAILYVIVMIGIISRLVGQSLAWTEEATRVFFLWLMWISVGTGFNHAESSRVVVFVNMMPKIVQKLCHACYYVASAALFVIMFVYGTKNAMAQFSMNEMGSAFAIPMWLVGIAVPIGSVVGVIGLIHTFVEEPYLLTTTADEMEADELAAAAREKYGDGEEKKEDAE